MLEGLRSITHIPKIVSPHGADESDDRAGSRKGHVVQNAIRQVPRWSGCMGIELRVQHGRANGEGLGILVVKPRVRMVLAVARAPERRAARLALYLQALRARRLDLGHLLLMVFRTHDQHGARRLLDHRRGHGAEDESLHDAVVVRADHDEIGLEVRRELDDSSPRGPLGQMGHDTHLRTRRQNGTTVAFEKRAPRVAKLDRGRYGGRSNQRRRLCKILEHVDDVYFGARDDSCKADRRGHDAIARGGRVNGSEEDEARRDGSVVGHTLRGATSVPAVRGVRCDWDHLHAGGMPVQLPASQQTPPSQLPTPVHVTLHAVPEQDTRLHEVMPPQLTVVVLALLETSVAHARAPEQSTAHELPLHEIGIGHESGFLHAMSHEDASHAIGPVHVPAVVHAILHSLPLHAIRCVHEPAPTQLMMHELAAVQSIVDVHEPAPVHVSAHGTPGGQTMGPVHVPAAMHSIVQVPPGPHVPTPASAQTAGHTSAASRTRASPASTSEIVESVPASSATLASPSRTLASRIIASTSFVTPASVSIARLPPSARPQPTPTNGMSNRTTRGRVRKIKTRVPSSLRSAPQGLHLGSHARGA